MERFADGIWIADGPEVVAAAGFHYPTRMAVIAAGGGLVLWSPVAPTDALRAQIAELGPVRWIVAPSRLHDTWLQAWRDACDGAEAWGAPGMAGLQVFGEARAPDWGDGLSAALIRTAIADEVVLYHAPSGTVLFCDLLQQMPPGWYTGWRALVARLDGMTGPEPRVPRKFRLALRDRAQARATVEDLLDRPVQRVLMAHGTPVTTDAQAFLRRAFGWLLR